MSFNHNTNMDIVSVICGLAYTGCLCGLSVPVVTSLFHGEREGRGEVARILYGVHYHQYCELISVVKQSNYTTIIYSELSTLQAECVNVHTMYIH